MVVRGECVLDYSYGAMPFGYCPTTSPSPLTLFLVIHLLNNAVG